MCVSVNGIIRLVESVCLGPKVIPLSGAHCNSFCLMSQVKGFPTFFLHCPPKSKKKKCYVPPRVNQIKTHSVFISRELKPDKLASHLPASNVSLGGRVPQVGNPWSSLLAYCYHRVNVISFSL